MNKFLIVASCVTALIVPTVAHAGYSAMAAGVNGQGWASGYPSMEGARRTAINRCRSLGGSCSVSVAEQDSWYFSAGECDGVPYIGASPQGWWRADQIVIMKGAADGNYDCEILWRK